MSLPDIVSIASLLEEGRAAEAKTQLQELITRVPAHVSARVIMARLLESELDYDGAFVQWGKAAYLCPENSVIEEGLRRAALRDLYASEYADTKTAPGTIASDSASTGKTKSPPQFQDLDKLIAELESARIIPDPDIPLVTKGELETDIDDVVSETLARIYANQNYFAEARIVYEKLADQYPEKADYFRKKASEMTRKTDAKP